MSETLEAGLPLHPMPSFRDFYEAVNGREPFPWQNRLAEEVSKNESWPQEVGIPTGLGKTACLEIAIWWLASQAERNPSDRTAPTRIWWVVNRRLLVDSTHDHALCISCLLADPQSTNKPEKSKVVLQVVSQRLRSLSAVPNADPLEVIKLRGGASGGRPTDPSQPAVILSTIPMYGSRILFRGYGSSRSARPIEAALAATDSLLLIDEAHLARYLMKLLPDLGECFPEMQPVINPARMTPRVIALTATGDVVDDRFELDENDRRNNEVSRRLDASKSVEIRQFESGSPAKKLCDAVLSLLSSVSSPSSCLTFVNTPSRAREVHELLRKQLNADEAELLMLTGRIREREAVSIRKKILDRLDGMPSNREAHPRSKHLVVVATQTLEVGADIDAELLVSECCGVRALTQRLGRLNRLGRYANARAIYVHCPPDKRRGENASWPVYGEEPSVVLERLLSKTGFSGVVDLSPSRVAEVLGEPGEERGRSPEVLPGLLWEWVKTTTVPQGEAPVEPYFSGVSASHAVSLMWRAHIPTPDDNYDRLWPYPMEKESIDIPISEVMSEIERLTKDGRVSRLISGNSTIESAEPSQLKPGDTIVLQSDRGYDEFGWAPQVKSTVLDLAILERGLPLDAEAIARFIAKGENGNEVDGKIRELVRTILKDGKAGSESENQDFDQDIDDQEREDALQELLQLISEDDRAPKGVTIDEWRQFNTHLANSIELIVNDGKTIPHLRLQKSVLSIRLDEDDEVSLVTKETAEKYRSDLEGHGEDVRDWAGRIAERVGILPEIARILRQAAHFHDVGKADERFQRWLDPKGVQQQPLAKSDMPQSHWSAARSAAGWPKGGRHEELSARLVCEWLALGYAEMTAEEADLLVHLVISHHGRGRPLVDPVSDNTLTEVEWELDGHLVRAGADLSQVDWDQPSRFWRLNKEYGPWNLALLEAIVRLADCSVSGAREVH